MVEGGSPDLLLVETLWYIMKLIISLSKRQQFLSLVPKRLGKEAVYDNVLYK